MPRTARILEVVISVFASIITSAVIVSWQLSAKLSNYENGIKANGTDIIALDAKSVQNRASIQGIETVNATQAAQIAVTDARYTEISRRLDSLDAKVDRLVERGRP